MCLMRMMGMLLPSTSCTRRHVGKHVISGFVVGFAFSHGFWVRSFMWALVSPRSIYSFALVCVNEVKALAATRH